MSAEHTALIGIAGTLVGAMITLAVQWFIAKRQQKDLFRLAALDKRLEKHQEAFALWRRLVSSLQSETRRGESVAECQAWWEQNCLYLTEEVRKGFYHAFISSELAVCDNPEVRTKVRTDILGLGKIIEKAVGLPPIGEEHGDLPQDSDKSTTPRKGAK